MKRSDRKAPPASDEYTKPAGKKKDTRKWCKGKKGREHSMEWVLDASRLGGLGEQLNWYVYKCAKCGKQTDFCYPAFGRLCKPCRCGHHTKDGHRTKGK
jgi:hypothetical protein